MPNTVEYGEIFPDPLYDEVLPGKRERTLGYHGGYETVLNRDNCRGDIYEALPLPIPISLQQASFLSR